MVCVMLATNSQNTLLWAFGVAQRRREAADSGDPATHKAYEVLPGLFQTLKKKEAGGEEKQSSHNVKRQSLSDQVCIEKAVRQ